MASIDTLLKPGTGLPMTQSMQSNSGKSGEESKFSFRDLLDIVNPLHHIPIIGQLYRDISGDVIHPAMKIAGGALFGGPLGAVFSVVQLAVFQKREEMAIPAGGISPETVADSYPFAEPKQHTYTTAITETDRNPYTVTKPKIRYNAQHTPIIYSDGISNPVRIRKESEPDILIANKPESGPIYDATALIKNTYGI